MKVLVTGGHGFVGRALIPCLIREGHDVVASSRNTGTVIAGARVQQVAPLGPDTDWSQALDGIEAVIHLAARVHVMDERAADPLSENMRINSDGTARLATQAVAAGVRHFIFLSTIKVNGEATPAEAFTASDRPQPQDPYAIAKLEAERRLVDIAQSSAMRVDIIRPPLVYGPGVAGNFRSLMGLCAKGLPLPLASIDNRRSLIYVGNLADLIAHILKRPVTSAAGVYLCKDGEDISTPELLARVSRALGSKARVLPLPPFLLRLAGAVLGKSAAVARLTQSLVVDDAPTRNDLDWTPPFSMIQGLKETADWYKNQP